jgi:chemotaxis protein MotB
LVAWVFVLILALGFLAVLVFVLLPLRKEVGELNVRLGQKERELTACTGRAEDCQKKLGEVTEASARAERAHQGLQEQLQRAEQEKQAALEALKKLQEDLSGPLSAELGRGDVLMRTEQGQVVVNLSDDLLFDTGEVLVSDQGKALLAKVAPTLRRLEGYVFQIAGHTDSARIVSPELREQYPTNWELSTARATNVVRYLEERGGVPGSRLVALGFAQHRPAAPNLTPGGRAQNRRIEITLVYRRPGAP